MKKILSILAIAGMFVACNSGNDESKKTDSSTTTTTTTDSTTMGTGTMGDTSTMGRDTSTHIHHDSTTTHKKK